MAAEEQTKAPHREAMQRLRRERQQIIEAVGARVKEQQKAIKAIKAELQQGERTVPELAAATGLPPDAILWYLMALKKYGEVGEGQADGSYFRYRLSPAAAPEEPGSSEPE